MANAKDQAATATERVQILSPLLQDEMDVAHRAQLLRQISQSSGVSERTLRRWLSAYGENGFQGLMPAIREYQGRGGSVNESVLDEAVILRREVPGRSVAQIIRIMEMEGLVAPGEIRRSTLQDHLEKRGYGSRQMAMFHSSGAGAARRFAKVHRNNLWQADIKYLLVLPETSKRKALQLYTSAFIDDATRYVVGCRVYEKQDLHCVLDCFRHAMEENGLPDAIFTDNGKQYISKQLNQVCAKLGIRLLHARPLHACSKGKIEALNKYLDKFVEEVKLKKPQSAAEVEHYLGIWMQELYQHKPHSALNGKTPDQAFRENDKPLRNASVEDLNYAFKLTEKRLVDKTGCISFRSRPWEAGQDLIGMRVDVVYNAGNPDELEIHHPDFEPRQISPLVIRPHSAPQRTLPVYTVPQTSRELDAAVKQNAQRKDAMRTAISFASIMQSKEGQDNV
jgi:putative transposase